MTANYGSVDYWQSRYAKQEEMNSFEWYQDWYSLKAYLCRFLKPESKILFVGNGDSQLPELAYREGFCNLWCVDWSENVVKKMTDKYKLAEITIPYTCHDISASLPYDDHSFDVIIDKGTLDCMQCSVSSADKTKRFLQGLYRVLTPKGIYICISFAARGLDFFDVTEKTPWAVTTESIPINSVSVTKVSSKPSLKKCAEELGKEELEKAEEKLGFHHIFYCKKDCEEAADPTSTGSPILEEATNPDDDAVSGGESDLPANLITEVDPTETTDERPYEETAQEQNPEENQ